MAPSNESPADISIGSGEARGLEGDEIYPFNNAFLDGRQVILVHGFRSQRESSAKSYGAFRRTLRNFAPRLEASILTLRWPGHYPYWEAVNRVRQIYAPLLAGFLSRSVDRANVRYVFIAHSLGCRLVLEALDRLSPRDRSALLPRIQLFLMAAAVPTERVAVGGELRDLARGCAAVDIYHSDQDEALGIAFRLGQRLAEGRFSEAVGLRGAPAELWGDRRHDKTPHRHGDYWTKDEVGYEIAGVLGAVEFRRVGRRGKSVV